MITQEKAATVKNYIEVFFAAALIVFGLSALAWSQSNHFTNLGAVAFCIAGLLIIIKANYEYKKENARIPYNEKSIFTHYWDIDPLRFCFWGCINQ